MKDEQINYWASMLNESMTDKASDSYLNEGIFKNMAAKVKDAVAAAGEKAADAGKAVAKKATDMSGAFANKAVKDLVAVLQNDCKGKELNKIKLGVQIVKKGDFGGNYAVIDFDVIKGKGLGGNTLAFKYDQITDWSKAKTVADLKAGLQAIKIKKMTADLVGIGLYCDNEALTGIGEAEIVDEAGKRPSKKAKAVGDAEPATGSEEPKDPVEKPVEAAPEAPDTAEPVKSKAGEEIALQDNKYVSCVFKDNCIWLQFDPNMKQIKKIETDDILFS